MAFSSFLPSTASFLPQLPLPRLSSALNMFSDNQIFRELHNAAIESLDNLQPINSFPVFAITEVMKSSCEEREFLAATGSVCLSDSLIKMFMDTIPPNRRSSHTLTVRRCPGSQPPVPIQNHPLTLSDFHRSGPPTNSGRESCPHQSHENALSGWHNWARQRPSIPRYSGCTIQNWFSRIRR